MSICPDQLPAASTTPLPDSDPRSVSTTQVAAGADDAPDAAVLDQLGAVAARRGRQRRVSSPAATYPCDGIEQSAERPLPRGAALRCAHACGVEQLGASRPRAAASTPRSSRRRSVVCVEARRRACPCGGTGTIRRRRGDPCDKLVEQVEAADGELEQRPVFARFDVRRQHAGRRLRRAHARRPIVDDLHRRAAARQLVGDRAADDARADDDDVARSCHGANLTSAHRTAV